MGILDDLAGLGGAIPIGDLAGALKGVSGAIEDVHRFGPRIIKSQRSMALAVRRVGAVAQGVKGLTSNINGVLGHITRINKGLASTFVMGASRQIMRGGKGLPANVANYYAQNVGKLKEHIEMFTNIRQQLAGLKVGENIPGSARKALSQYASFVGSVEQAAKGIKSTALGQVQRGIGRVRTTMAVASMDKYGKNLSTFFSGVNQQVSNISGIARQATKPFAMAGGGARFGTPPSGITPPPTPPGGGMAGPVPMLMGEPGYYSQMASEAGYAYANLRNWIDTTFGLAIRRVVMWGGAAMLVYGGFQKIKNIMGEVMDIEQATLRVLKVLPASVGYTAIADSAIEAAIKYRSAIKDVLDVQKMWAQQGKNLNDVLKYTEKTMTGHLAMNVAAVKIVEMLTTATNIFALQEGELNRLLDSTMRVQAEHVVTTQDLVDAYSLLGPAVATLGGSFEEMYGYVAAVKTGTMKSGKYIANALRTAFARIERPQTQKMLRDIGVYMLDAANNARPLRDVLRDMVEKWHESEHSIKRQQKMLETISGQVMKPSEIAGFQEYARVSVGRPPVQKVEFAMSIARLRRFQPYIVLMENFAEATQTTKEAYSAFGQATRAAELETSSLGKELEGLHNTVIKLASGIYKTNLVPIFKPLVGIVGIIVNGFSKLSGLLGSFGTSLVALGGLRLLLGGMGRLSDAFLRIEGYREGAIRGMDQLEAAHARVASSASDVAQKYPRMMQAINRGMGVGMGPATKKWREGALWTQQARLGLPKEFMVRGVAPMPFEEALKLYAKMRKEIQVGAVKLQKQMKVTMPEGVEPGQKAWFGEMSKYHSTMNADQKKLYGHLVHNKEAVDAFGSSAKRAIRSMTPVGKITRMFAGLKHMILGVGKSLLFMGMYMAAFTIAMKGIQGVKEAIESAKARRRVFTPMDIDLAKQYAENLKSIAAQILNMPEIKLTAPKIQEFQSQMKVVMGKMLEVIREGGELTPEMIEGFMIEVGIDIDSSSWEKKKESLKRLAGLKLGVLEKSTEEVRTNLDKAATFTGKMMEWFKGDLRIRPEVPEGLTDLFQEGVQPMVVRALETDFPETQIPFWARISSSWGPVREKIQNLNKEERDKFKETLSEMFAKELVSKAALGEWRELTELFEGAEDAASDFFETLDTKPMKLAEFVIEAKPVITLKEKERIREQFGLYEVLDKTLDALMDMKTKGKEVADKFVIDFSKIEFPLISAVSSFKRALAEIRAETEVTGALPVSEYISAYESYMSTLVGIENSYNEKLATARAKLAAYGKFGLVDKGLRDLPDEEAEKLGDAIYNLRREIYTLQQTADNFSTSAMVSEVQKMLKLLYEWEFALERVQQLGSIKLEVLGRGYSQIEKYLESMASSAAEVNESLEKPRAEVLERYIAAWQETTANMSLPEATNRIYTELLKLTTGWALDDEFRELNSNLKNIRDETRRTFAGVGDSIVQELMEAINTLDTLVVERVQKNAELRELMGQRGGWKRTIEVKADREAMRFVRDFFRRDEVRKLSHGNKEAYRMVVAEAMKVAEIQKEITEYTELQNLYYERLNDTMRKIAQTGEQIRDVFVEAFSDAQMFVDMLTTEKPFEQIVENIMKPLGKMWMKKVAEDLFTGFIPDKTAYKLGETFTGGIAPEVDQIRKIRDELESRPFRIVDPNMVGDLDRFYYRLKNKADLLREEYERTGDETLKYTIEDIDNLSKKIEEAEPGITEAAARAAAGRKIVGQGVQGRLGKPELAIPEGKLGSSASNPLYTYVVNLAGEAGTGGMALGRKDVFEMLSELETRGEPSATRFEEAVYKDIKADPYKYGIGKDLLKHFETFPEAGEQFYRDMATSWGRTQIMGYNLYQKEYVDYDLWKKRGTFPEYQGDITKQQQATEDMLAMWEKQYDLEYKTKDDFLKAVRTWNTGRPSGQLHTGYRQRFDDWWSNKEIAGRLQDSADEFRAAMESFEKQTDGFKDTVSVFWDSSEKMKVASDRLAGGVEDTGVSLDYRKMGTGKDIKIDKANLDISDIDYTKLVPQYTSRAGGDWRYRPIRAGEIKVTPLQERIRKEKEEAAHYEEVVPFYDLEREPELKYLAKEPLKEPVKVEVVNWLEMEEKVPDIYQYGQPGKLAEPPEKLTPQQQKWGAVGQMGATFIGSYIGTEVAQSLGHEPTYVATGAQFGGALGQAVGSIWGPGGALVGSMAGTILGGAIGGLWGEVEDMNINVKAIVDHTAAIRNNTSMLGELSSGIFNLPALQGISGVARGNVSLNVSVSNTFSGGNVGSNEINDLKLAVTDGVEQAIKSASRSNMVVIERLF